MLKMSMEQMDHFLRHVKMHAEELREGTFNKGPDYVEKLKDAQYCALEVSHDIIHILRFKKFKGYENADFSFCISLPDNFENYTFSEFGPDSFRAGTRLKNALDMGVEEERLSVEVHVLEMQMENLASAVRDAGVLIKLLEDHFSKKGKK